MNKILLLGFLFLISDTVWSVGVSEPTSVITQSDGTNLTVLTYGEAESCYYTTTDGVILCHNGYNFYVAVIDENGELTTSDILAHEKGQRSAKESELVKKQDTDLFYAAKEAEKKAARKKEAIVNKADYFPHTGTPKALVILAEFTDSVFSLKNPKETFNEYLNAKTMGENALADSTVKDNYGSVAKYFSDMSFGTFVPQFDVCGPVKLPHNLKHYGNYDDNGSDRFDSLVIDACNAVDDSVDFSQYDADNNGNVDLVYIIYASYSSSWTKNSSDCIWPKSFQANFNIKYDGKGINWAGINNELNARTTTYKKPPYKHCNGIGLFCHEFSHCMGLPDFYATSTEAKAAYVKTMLYWDLMDSGEYTNRGNTPTAYTAWEREAMGWMKIDTLKTSQEVTMTPVQDGGKAYRIMNDNDETGQEYYIVENVQQKGWNGGVYGHGLMVYHVDYDENAFTLSVNKVNNTIGHPRMTFVAADGNVMNKYNTVDENGDSLTAKMFLENMGGDPFPGTSNTRFLTDTSTVKSVVYTGTYMDKPIVDICEDTLATIATVTFKFYASNKDLATAIELPSANGEDSGDGKIYTTNGIYIGTDLNTLKKGVYIRNRHKLIK